MEAKIYQRSSGRCLRAATPAEVAISKEIWPLPFETTVYRVRRVQHQVPKASPTDPFDPAYDESGWYATAIEAFEVADRFDFEKPVEDGEWVYDRFPLIVVVGEG